MDIAVLLGVMFFCFAIGVPIAYSLALAAIAGAFWIGIPLEAVMLKISDGVSKVAMLTIPFFVLAGAIMAEGGMGAACGVCRRAGRLHAHPRRAFRRQRAGHHVSQRHFGIAVGYLCDRFGDDPANGEKRLSGSDQRHHHCLGAGAIGPRANAVIYSLPPAHHFHHQLFMAGVVPGFAGAPSSFCVSDRLSWLSCGQTVPREAKITIEAPSLVRLRHSAASSAASLRHRGWRGRLRVGVLRDHVHLPRLPLARPAALVHRRMRTGR